MEKIQYVGETLWIGYFCKALIYGGFLSAIVATIAYLTGSLVKNEVEAKGWFAFGRKSFIFHGVSILILLCTMFYSMLTFKYEYNYVFSHVSDDLPMRYIFSAFWEGQEGSFLLWMFWHIVLGFIFLRKDLKLNAPVMAMIALAEIWLNSMLLGVYLPFTDERLGSNPMSLLREGMAAPIFNNADYLSLIKGRGLNPLLQNYWMTIHPPTVFLGFALTTIPFGYAFGAMFQKQYDEWLRPALKWALLTAGILGIAILMGSVWAYEALSFGGYWAWDPVENTSLVPWIILVAGIHTNLTSISSNHGRRFTILFYLTGMVLIIYSTLLTRSGILGDTSAHAFTEMGLETQLVGFLLTFALIGLVYYFIRYKSIPEPVKEESASSREFWMFLGALVLLFSGILINGASSLPVYNKIVRHFDPSFVGNVLKDPIEHYNKYQLWIAILIGFLSATGIWLQWRSDELKTKKVVSKLGIYLIIAIVLTYLTTLWISLPTIPHLIMAVASWFTICSNGEYLFRRIKLDRKGASSAFAHIGFGAMSIGILATGLSSKNLNNPFMFKELFATGDEEKYVQLIKGSPLMLKDYLVTYEKDTIIDRARFYDISFKHMDKDMVTVLDSFMTRPNAVYSNDFTKIAAFNPDTRHYLHKDIFTCVVQLPPAISDVELAKQIEDSTVYVSYKPFIGDTVGLPSKDKLVITGIETSPESEEYRKHKHELGFGLSYFLLDEYGRSHKGSTAIGLDGNVMYKYPGVIEKLGLRIRPSESFMSTMVTSEEKLAYTTLSVKQGIPVMYNGYEIILATFEKDIDSSRFEVKNGDIAVAGVLQIKDKEKIYVAKPLFIIRDSSPFGIKDYTADLGLHTRLSNINPKTNEFEIKLALDKRAKSFPIPIEVATNVPRNDYIILEAKIFPGINVFWLGATMMMLGLLMSWSIRWRKL